MTLRIAPWIRRYAGIPLLLSRFVSIFSGSSTQRTSHHAYIKFGTNRDESIVKWSGSEPADHRRESPGFSHAAKIPNDHTMVNSLTAYTSSKGNPWLRAAKAA